MTRGTSERSTVDGALAANLQRGIARRLMAGDSANDIVSWLGVHGVSQLIALNEIAAIEASPVFEVARQVAARRDKLASLLEVLGRQARQAPTAASIPVENRPTKDTFFQQYYFQNRPVLLKGWMDGWPALSKWSPTYWAERFGDVKVEITAEREADPRFEDNLVDHRRTVTVREFVESVLHRPGNDRYAVAKNHWLEQPELESLLDDFTAPQVVRATHGDRVPSLWFGPAGTVTPLHHDATNILFGQVYGRKLVRLIGPYHLEQVYNDRACFSAVDLDAVDFQVHPDMRDVLVLETIVEPGDFLLLPIGWWHWVRSLDASISLSFQTFALVGRPIVWRHPHAD